MDAAIELIGEKGFDTTTAAEIGERAGYSRSMVHARYGSKESLLESSPSIARSSNTIRAVFCEFSSNTPVLTLAILLGTASFRQPRPSERGGLP